MADDGVAALIERVVAGSRITSRAARDDLRRELLTHFEEAAASPDAVEYAIRRFGEERAVTAALRRVYRRDYFVLYLAKIAVSLIASAAAALLILALVHLRVELKTEAWRLAPGFSRAAGLSLAVVIGLVAARELVRQPFSRSRAAVLVTVYLALGAAAQVLIAHSAGAFVTATMLVAAGLLCSTLASRPVRWLLMFATFVLAEYGVHLAVSATLPLSRAALAGAMLLAVWASTMLILTCADHAFRSLLTTA